MMLIRHLSYDALDDFRAGALDERRRRRAADHLQRCARCQARLRFVARVATEVPAASTVTLSRDALDRALQSRASGERRIIPLSQPLPQRRTTRSRIGLGIGVAAAAVLGAVLLTMRGSVASAGDAESVLLLSPMHPLPGDSISVSYTPAGGSFGGAKTLSLRARLRHDGDAMYSNHGELRVVARLERGKDGRFEAQFRLPDSVFYAVFAVEDTAALHVDDNSGRFWDLLTYARDGRPRYEALEQRASDMMGRSWEQAYASAVELTLHYPDRFSAWNLREFFDEAMYGAATGDSLERTYRTHVDSLIARLKAEPHLQPAELGEILVRQLRLRNGSPQDRAEFRFWLDRLQREYPHHGRLAQYYAVSFSPDDWKRPEWMLDSLETLYSRLWPVIGSGGHTFLAVGYQIAAKTKDDRAYERWTERLYSDGPDSSMNVTLALASRRTLHHVAEERARALLATDAGRLIGPRRLGETQEDFERRGGEARRRLFVTLGRGLLADGQMRQALDTLQHAVEGDWDARIYRSIAEAYRGAGDTSAAVRMLARVAVDPRTNPDTSTAYRDAALKFVPAGQWDSLTRVATSEMYRLTAESSHPRAIRGRPRVVDSTGRAVEVRELLGRKSGVVIFWSRDCGWAVEALPAIVRAAAKLEQAGTPVVFLAEKVAPTEQDAAYLREKGWKWPVYRDYNHETANAFVNFGTPQYFVVDANGRIRFTYADNEMDLIRQAGAVQ